MIETLGLNAEDTEVFYHTLEAPPPPTAALRHLLHGRPPWQCPFCGSKGLGAWFRWASLGTPKLHRCKNRFCR